MVDFKRNCPENWMILFSSLNKRVLLNWNLSLMIDGAQVYPNEQMSCVMITFRKIDSISRQFFSILLPINISLHETESTTRMQKIRKKNQVSCESI